MRGMLRWLRAQWLMGPVWRTGDGLCLLGRGRIHVGATDNRGRALRRRHGVTQPPVNWLWKRLRRALQPRTLVDIGANYGEISLACRYGRGESVVLFEPNRDVRAMLERSIATRPDADCFRVSGAFLGLEGEAVTFTIDQKWSGTSSSYIPPTDAAYKGEGEQTVAVEETTSRGLGHVLEELGIAEPGVVLGKIDIEGGELWALRGAAEWLRSLPGWAIICEVNQDFWGADTSASEIAETLRAFGEVFHFPRGERARELAGADPPTASDVVIASPGRVADTVRALRRPPWV